MASLTFDDIELDVDGASVVLSQEKAWGRVRFSVDGAQQRVRPARRQAPGVWAYPIGEVRGHEIVLESRKPRFRTSMWRSFLAKATSGTFGGYVWTWQVYVDGLLAAERQFEKI